MNCPKCGVPLADNAWNCVACGWGSREEDSNKDMKNTEEMASDNGKSFDDLNYGINNSTGILKSKLSSKKQKMILGIVLAAVILLSITVAVYLNSDSYKIKSAVKLIEAGECSEGMSKVYDVYTPQAEAVKRFVNVENAKQAFLFSLNDEDLESAFSAYQDFSDAVSNFNKADMLPGSLHKLYNRYKAAFDYTTEYTYATVLELNVLYSKFYDLQLVMMNEVEANNSSKYDTFTLNDMQERVDCSKDALQALREYDFSCIEVTDFNAKLYCITDKAEEDGKSFIHTSTYLSEMIETLESECESEIESSQSHIDYSSEKFKMDDDLYRTNPEKDYESFVGANLKNISCFSDIDDNCVTILELLRRDMLYYLISGLAVNS